MNKMVEDAFKSCVGDHLSRLEKDLITALKSLIEYQYPDEMFAIAFEVFSDSFTSGFPARAYFMDRDNTEFFIYENGVAKYPSPIDPDLLDIDCVYSDNTEEEFESQDPDLDPWAIATNEFIIWFFSCWKKAGGRHFPLVATIAHHDSSKEFNLLTGQWQESYAAFTP